jgi:hypothetical protein
VLCWGVLAFFLAWLGKKEKKNKIKGTKEKAGTAACPLHIVSAGARLSCGCPAFIFHFLPVKNLSVVWPTF